MGVNKTGRNLTRDLVSGDSSSNITHGEVGTDTTAFTDNDTALGAAVLRKTFESHPSTDNQTIYQIWLASTEANGNTLAEAGLFNAASGGVMLCRDVFTGLAKTNAMEVLIEAKVVYSDES